MKNTTWKRLLAGTLAGAMLLGLTACGGGDTETETEQAQTTETVQTTAAEEGTGYVATVLDLDAPIDWYNSAQVVGDRIYVQGGHYDDEQGISETLLAVLDNTGSLLDTITIPEENNRYVNTVTVGNDCLLAILYEWRTDDGSTDDDADAEPAADDWTTATVNESTAVSDDWTTADADDWTQSSTEDLPDDWTTDETPSEETEEATAEEATDEEEDDETDWIYEEEESSGYSVYLLAKYSMDGELLAETEIEAAQDSTWFFIDALCQDVNGNIILSTEGDTCSICVYDSDLNLQGSVPVDNWISSMFVLPDGRTVAAYWGGAGRTLCEVDVENLTMGEEVAMDDVGANLYYFCIGMDGLLYGYNNDALYRIDLETGVAEQIMYFLDWDVNGSNFNGLVPLEDGSFLAFGYDSKGSAELTQVTAVPLSEIPVKTEITLGCGGMNYNLRQYILDFNRKNDTYRIVVRDYSDYETEDDYMAGYNQLDQDILSGNCPDILVMDNLSTEKYVAKGLLTDLYTLMSEDTLQKDDFIPSLLNCMEINGSLYTIASNFDLQTLLGAKAYVGEESGWSLADFLAAVEKLPEDGLVLDYQTRDSFLNTLLYFTYDTFVDKDSGQCHFDSQEFVDALNACLVFPEDYDAYEAYHVANGTDGGYSVDMDYYKAQYQELRDGVMLLYAPDFWSLMDLRWGSVSCITDDLICVGYPGAGGNGAVLRPSTEYAISASSQYQDVAWEFLCTLFESSETYSYYDGLPALQETFDVGLEKAMDKSYYIDENGETVYYENDYETPLTQEQADWFRDLVENATSSYHYDEQLMSIVSEEAAAFFAGQKSAEDVAALIQNRVQTYLDEQQ
jgi:ABC-type glycerol-3-phosphate transport system substrate-binding protein